MATSKSAGRSLISLAELVNSNEDLNRDFSHRLHPNAKLELDEHLNDLIQSELNEEAEDDVFIASFHMPETQPGSAPQAEESPAGQTLPRGDQQGDVNMAGAAPELVPQGTATEPAAEGQSSNAPEPDADESSDESEECAMEAENQKEEQQVPLRSGPRGRSGCAILSPAGRRGAIEALRAMRLKELKKASQGQKLEIQLGQIRYSQDSIMGVFKEGRKLKETRLGLESGQLSLNKIPAISVVLSDGEVVSADNRRLWTFKHCGMPNNTRIPVIKKRPDDLFNKKLTTFSQGLSIARRNNKADY